MGSTDDAARTAESGASGGGTGRRRNRRGEGSRLRDEIVSAAERLLVDQPVETLSLRAVAREAGISAPSLYPHFADRRELVWAVLERLFAELGSATAAAAAVAEDPQGRLRAWCLAYCRYGLAQPGHYRVLFESWIAQRVDTPLAELPGHVLYQQMRTAICDTGPVADPHQTVTLLWASLHGLVSLRINKPSFPWPPLEQLIDDLIARLQPRCTAADAAPSTRAMPRSTQ